MACRTLDVRALCGERAIAKTSVGARVLGEMRDQPHMHQVQEGGATGCGGVGLSVERTERRRHTAECSGVQRRRKVCLGDRTHCT